MKKICIILAIMLFFSLTVFAQTKVGDDPTKISIGARPFGMGKAYVGLADDINSLFLNPAGLAKIDSFQGMSLSGKFINEVNYLILGAAIPTKQGVFGVGYIGSGFGITTLATTFESGRVSTTNESLSYSDYDTILLFSYASELQSFFDFPIFADFDFGATLKMYSKELTGTSVTGGTASGYDIDLGLVYKPGGPFSAGIYAKNVLPASMGGKVVWATGVVESLPSTITSGISLKLLGENGLRQIGMHALRLNFDFDYHPNRAYVPNLMHVGLEWSPLRFLDLRVGIDQDAIGLGGGGLGVANNFTAGVGLVYKKFRFDYAYHQFQATPGVDNHYFALTYGLFDREPEPVVETARELSVPEEVVVVEEEIIVEEIKPISKPVKKKAVVKAQPKSEPKKGTVGTARELSEPKPIPEVEKPKVDQKALDDWAKDSKEDGSGINYGGILAGIAALALGVFLIAKFAIKK